MKNTILVIVSIVVGYGFAYFCAFKHLAPFSKIEAHNPQGEGMKMGASMPDEKVKVRQVSQTEMERLSNNYVAWISNLAARASKGVPKKELSSQVVVRGGVLSAGLLNMLAKGKKDVQYIFGKESYGSPIYMILSNTAADEPSESSESSGTPGTEPPPAVSASLPYIDGVDSASMCPPICPIVILPWLPPVTIDMPPPTPPTSGGGG